MSLKTARFLAFNCEKTYGDLIAASHFADLAAQLEFENDYAEAYLIFA